MPQEYIKGQKVVRWLDILMILAGSPLGMKASELAARTEQSRRTLERDMLEIERIKQLKVIKHGTRWFLMEGATMRPVAFRPEEAVELLMACRLAVRHADYNDKVLALALAKVNGVIPKEAQLVRRFVQETTDELTAKPDADQRAGHLQALVRAWIGSFKVEIDYTNAQGKATTRVIHPYAIEPRTAVGHGTYLMAKDEASNQVRSFKIERIDRVKVRRAQYRLPPDFSLAEHLHDSWGIWGSDPPQEVILRFRPPASRRVAESNWHLSQQLERLKGGGLEMRLRVRGTVEIQPWIQGWGPDVEVISPPDLPEAVANRARETAERYPQTTGRKAPN